MKTLIFDRNNGLLQWVSSETEPMAALKEFDAAVEVHPNESELNLDDWRFHLVSDEKASEVQAWADAGSRTADDPLRAVKFDLQKEWAADLQKLRDAGALPE